MTSTCGGTAPLPRRASRCSTPKRCCSSTTTSAEVEEVDVLLEQGVGADDDAGVAAGDVEQGAAALGGRLAAGEERDPGAVLGPAQHAALGEVAEHRGDGAVVLRGEHLGRGEQRGLPAGSRRRRASRAARRRSCPSRPRPGAAGASARRGPSPRRCVAPTSRWPAVSVNGSRASNASRSPPGRAGRGVVDCPDAAAPPLRERHLEDERLLVAQPPPGRLDLGHRVGGVDAAQRVGARHQPAPGAHVGRQGVGHVVEHVEHPAHALGDGPGVQLADRAVDGDEGLALPGVEVVEHRVAGVGQLEPVVVGADRAGEDAARPGDQRLLVAPRLEEGDVDVVPAVGDDDVEHRALALAASAGSRRDLTSATPTRNLPTVGGAEVARRGCGSGAARTPGGHRRCGCRGPWRTSWPPRR